MRHCHRLPHTLFPKYQCSTTRGDAATYSFDVGRAREWADETDGGTGMVAERERAPLDACFAYADVHTAYGRAVESWAIPVRPAMVKSWGQKIGYVRDIDGSIVRLESHMSRTM